MLLQTDATFLRIQQQSHGLSRTVSERQLSKKKKSERERQGEKEAFFHFLNRDRGEERGIRRITKRPTD